MPQPPTIPGAPLMAAEESPHFELQSGLPSARFAHP